MARSNVVINLRDQNLNLRRSIAKAVSAGSVKLVARQYGISPREVAALRTELQMPRVPIFLEIAKRDPALRAQVIAILSGDGEAGTPESVQAIIRFMQERTRK